MKKLTHTLPNGETIRVYDNGGKTFDRYTVVCDNDEYPTHEMCPMLALSSDPTSPQGFSQHTEGHEGRHLGKRVAFESLPENIQRHITYRLSVE